MRGGVGGTIVTSSLPKDQVLAPVSPEHVAGRGDGTLRQHWLQLSAALAGRRDPGARGRATQPPRAARPRGGSLLVEAHRGPLCLQPLLLA